MVSKLSMCFLISFVFISLFKHLIFNILFKPNIISFLLNTIILFFLSFFKQWPRRRHGTYIHTTY